MSKLLRRIWSKVTRFKSQRHSTTPKNTSPGPSGTRFEPESASILKPLKQVKKPPKSIQEEILLRVSKCRNLDDSANDEVSIIGNVGVASEDSSDVEYQDDGAGGNGEHWLD